MLNQSDRINIETYQAAYSLITFTRLESRRGLAVRKLKILPGGSGTKLLAPFDEGQVANQNDYNNDSQGNHHVLETISIDPRGQGKDKDSREQILDEDDADHAIRNNLDGIRNDT